MTKSEKLNMLRDMTGETNEGVLSTYLYLAGQKVLRKAFPYDPSQTVVPLKYEAVQLEVATYLLNKRGAEGQTAHSENGIGRSYENGDVPDSMLSVIVPYAAVGGEVIPDENA